MHIYLFDVHTAKRKMYNTGKKQDYSKKGWAKQPYSGLGSPTPSYCNPSSFSSCTSSSSLCIHQIDIYVSTKHSIPCDQVKCRQSKMVILKLSYCNLSVVCFMHKNGPVREGPSDDQDIPLPSVWL